MCVVQVCYFEAAVLMMCVFVAASNCVLDDWGEWGQCSKRCGWGSKERLRRVLVERRNGGEKCGQTRQRVYCYGTKCKVERAQGGEAIRGTCDSYVGSCCAVLSLIVGIKCSM